MELSLLTDYKSEVEHFRGLSLQAATEIYVDDLRTDNDNSLDLVPRIETFEELKFWFKLDVLTTHGTSIVKPGDIYFKLVGFYLRIGVAAFIPIVLDQNGNPLRDIFVWASWPSAPKFPEGSRVAPDYSENGGGVGGFTGENGDIGFGYGGGAVVGGDGGVYRIWLSSDPPGEPRQGADCGIKLGWFGGTDHLTANPIFQVVEVEGEQPPPSEGGEHVLIQTLDGVEISRNIITVETTLRAT